MMCRFTIAVAFVVSWPAAADKTAPGGVRERSEPAEQELKRVFGSIYSPLPNPPASLIRSEDESEDELRDLLARQHGICVDDDDDEFKMRDCKRRNDAFRRQKEVHYVEVSLRTNDVHYDFRKGAFAVTWTDELLRNLSCEQPALSIWKPPPSTRMYLKHRDTRHYFFMPEADARDLKQRLGDVPEAQITIVGSVRRDADWRQPFRLSIDGVVYGMPWCHSGSLLRVHAFVIRLGELVWGAPEWAVRDANPDAAAADGIQSEP